MPARKTRSRKSRIDHRVPASTAKRFRSRKKSVKSLRISSRKAAAQPVEMFRLFDFLSEMTAVEHGNLELYRHAIDRATDPETLDTLRCFQQQTENHLDLLQIAIRDLGGNPVYFSLGAEISELRLRAFMDLVVPEPLQTIADLENILVGETRCSMNWRFLRGLIPRVDEVHAREILTEIVIRVEAQKNDQVDWARSNLERLVLEYLLRPSEAMEAA